MFDLSALLTNVSVHMLRNYLFQLEMLQLEINYGQLIGTFYIYFLSPIIKGALCNILEPVIVKITIQRSN